MRNLLPKFILKQFSTYIALTVIFIHNVVLEKDLECPCDKRAKSCTLYMLMPFLVLFVLQLWTDKKCLRAWRYTCSCYGEQCCNDFIKKRCTFLWVLVNHIIKAAFVGLLWVVSVLIDGDWYVCCYNDGSDQQKQLACKHKGNIIAEDQDRTIVADLKNTSWIIGTTVLFWLLLGVALMSAFEWRKCYKDSCCCDRKDLYYKVILNEEKGVLKEILRKEAKEKLEEEIKKKIREKKWDTYFDVAKELIEQCVDETKKEHQVKNQQKEPTPEHQVKNQQKEPTPEHQEEEIQLLPQETAHPAENPGSSDEQ